MSNSTHVNDSFFVMTPRKTIDEAHDLLQKMYPNFPINELHMVENDVINLFSGRYPGYRKSTTHYHDLPHTMSVYLAVIRLLHGAFCAREPVSQSTAWNGLMGALFHDVGLIQTADDTIGTGAKYTSGHEKRSMEFVQQYFSRHDRHLPLTDVKVINKTIVCTILSIDPSTIRFPNQEIRTIGFAVGASDLYAQMADRAYLEKLLLLYDEFVEAHIPGYKSPLDLLRGTQNFWDFVVSSRIQEKMNNIGDYFKYHFSTVGQGHENLYLVSIKKNLAYLQQVLNDHEASYHEMLRRTGELIDD